MKLKLHHIGIAVPSIAEFAEIFRALGFDEMTQLESEPIQKVSEVYISVEKGQDVYFELIEPLGDDSPITNFLEKKGSGVHHFCFRVDDIDEAGKELVEKGFKMVRSPVDCVGIDNSFKREYTQPSKIAFFLLPNKLLVELLQEGE